MNQPYSVVADFLSKFDSWSVAIQALWILAGTAMVLGTILIVMRGIRDIVRLRRPRDEAGRLIQALYQAPDGRLMFYHHGQGAQEVEQSPASRALIGWMNAEEAAATRP